MEREPRTLTWETKSMFWMFFLLGTAEAKAEMPHHALSISAPHLLYTCPEGANVELVCEYKGDLVHHNDLEMFKWIFTPYSEQHCSFPGKHPRQVDSHKANGPGVKYWHNKTEMSVTLENVTHKDEGRYCCVVTDLSKIDKHHINFEQRSHSHMILKVTPRRSGHLNCTVSNPEPPGGSVPVVLALVACILALLSLPLILVLVYRQRQNSQSHRRAQELVRMDSESRGHENPVFLGGSPHRKTRTVSQIMTRQSSETGCHLLSDPGTPLSPPGHEDVFFPSQDAIPESPDILQI